MSQYNIDLTPAASAINALVDQWAILEWHAGDVSPPKDQAFGTHLAVYLFCPFGHEIMSLNKIWFVIDSDNRVARVKSEYEAVGVNWAFLFSTLIKYPVYEMPRDVHDLLELPVVPSEIDIKLTPDIRRLRRLPELHPFRQAGYPDDVCVHCSSEYMGPQRGGPIGEIVWVRLFKQEVSDRFVGILLNEPQHSMLEAGQKISIDLVEAGREKMLVCNGGAL